jgi:superoxide dismutase
MKLPRFIKLPIGAALVLWLSLLNISAQNRIDTWTTDKGLPRGVSWAICYQNPRNGKLSNHWISLHEVGSVTGFIPILVMDVWEHAYLLDYKPAERSKYIEALLLKYRLGSPG